MKPVKAIDLVFKAQPIVAALREIASRCDDNPKNNAVVTDCDEWLDAARELMEKKGKVKS